MLILSRKVNDKICIGEDIEITVVSVNGDTVRLGIDAPREIKILRHEVLLEIQKQNQEAAAHAGETDDLKNLLAARKPQP